METDAYYLIMASIYSGRFLPVVSPVHYAEAESISEVQEQSQLMELLKRLDNRQIFDMDNINIRADQLFAMGFGIADAYHLACAEMKADVFISCDDLLLKRAAMSRQAKPVNGGNGSRNYSE
jgi:predicted nucleic acid-binding protein